MLGFLASDVVKFLTMVQQVIHSNVSTPKEQSFVFSKLALLFKKGLRRSLFHVYRHHIVNYFVHYALSSSG